MRATTKKMKDSSMKIVSGKEALIAVALGFKAYTRTKSELIESRPWEAISDDASLRLFLDDECNRMFEYGIKVEKE